jgi:hypothetical protein
MVQYSMHKCKWSSTYHRKNKEKSHIVCEVTHLGVLAKSLRYSSYRDKRLGERK